MKNTVSVIITTKNSNKTIKTLLESIRQQSYHEIEIIVVDNSSSDQTVETCKHFTKKVFIKGPERSAQRNFGAFKATGKYLFFLDADMRLTRNVVSECVSIFSKKEKVGGVVVPEKSFGHGFWAKAKAFEREINEGQSYFVAARFYPKAIFQEFGGYDENLTGPEDWDLPRRISTKFKIASIKSYILHNEGKPDLLKLARRKYYYGLSVHKYLKKQKISVISPTTIYFLRPAFYRKWRQLLAHPFLTLGMAIMLTAETIGGGMGYLVGRLTNEK